MTWPENCPNCGASVGPPSRSCPSCGRMPPEARVRLGCVGRFVVGFVLLSAIVAGLILIRVAIEAELERRGLRLRGPAAPRVVGPPLAAGIAAWLDAHGEYGRPLRVEALPDRDRGRRQSVLFSHGRRLDFDLSGAEVEGVYVHDPTVGRRRIWPREP